jgi:hypothetical protein
MSVIFAKGVHLIWGPYHPKKLSNWVSDCGGRDGAISLKVRELQSLSHNCPFVIFCHSLPLALPSPLLAQLPPSFLCLPHHSIHQLTSTTFFLTPHYQYTQCPALKYGYPTISLSTPLHNDLLYTCLKYLAGIPSSWSSGSSSVVLCPFYYSIKPHSVIVSHL